MHVVSYFGNISYLHTAVAPSLGHSVDILFKSVNVRVLDDVGSGLLDGRADVLHILHQLINETLRKNFEIKAMGKGVFWF